MRHQASFMTLVASWAAARLLTFDPCRPPRTAAADQPGVRPGHEPHQPAGPDPAGQEGEGAGVRASDGEGAAAPQGVRHPGEQQGGQAYR